MVVGGSGSGVPPPSRSLVGASTGVEPQERQAAC